MSMIKRGKSVQQWWPKFLFQNEIRSSLVLSMLKQMLGDDKTEEVRESVVRSLALLMAFIDEPDKFPQVRCGKHREQERKTNRN